MRFRFEPPTIKHGFVTFNVQVVFLRVVIGCPTGSYVLVSRKRVSLGDLTNVLFCFNLVTGGLKILRPRAVATLSCCGLNRGGVALTGTLWGLGGGGRGMGEEGVRVQVSEGTKESRLCDVFILFVVVISLGAAS